MSVFDAVPAVADGDVQQPVVLVAGLGRRVEVDLLDAVDLGREAEPQDLAAGAAERVGGGVVAVHSVTTLCRNVLRLRGVRRRLGAEVARFSVWTV